MNPMAPEIKSILNNLRLRLLEKADKELTHQKTMPPGSVRREQQRGIALGLERAARMVEEDILNAP